MSDAALIGTLYLNVIVSLICVTVCFLHNYMLIVDHITLQTDKGGYGLAHSIRSSVPY